MKVTIEISSGEAREAAGVLRNLVVMNASGVAPEIMRRVVAAVPAEVFRKDAGADGDGRGGRSTTHID